MLNDAGEGGEYLRDIDGVCEKGIKKLEITLVMVPNGNASWTRINEADPK